MIGLPGPGGRQAKTDFHLSAETKALPLGNNLSPGRCVQKASSTKLNGRSSN